MSESKIVLSIFFQLDNPLSRIDSLSILISYWRKLVTIHQAKIDVVNKDIVEIRNKRNEFAKNLSSTMVRRYAALIKNKGRKAVVFNENGTCGGCHYKIRPQLLIEIGEANKIINCESCGRMIVAKAEN